MQPMPNEHAECILRRDRSKESQQVEDALEQAGRRFLVVYEEAPRSLMPVIEYPYLTVRGYEEICAYLLPQLGAPE